MEVSKIRFVRSFFVLGFICIILRLAFIQIINSQQYRASAQTQYQSTQKYTPFRGEILSSDSFPIASTIPSYLLFADPALLNQPPQVISSQLVAIIDQDATPSSVLTDKEKIEKSISDKSLRWVPIRHKIGMGQKKQIESFKLEGIGFENEPHRFYPESSMASQLLGFVGKDDSGQDKGYFGLEGYYDLELSGESGFVTQEKDQIGKPILMGKKHENMGSIGRSLKTSIDRPAQFIIEKKLREGLEKYQAIAGNVIVIEPASGRVLAMASLPAYDPGNYPFEDQSLFKNPAVSETYEPGSTFKVLVMAAAINEGAVKPDTVCDSCSGPLSLDKYTIRTWNNKYFPNSNMTDVIVRSDNIGMVFVGEKLGTEKFLEYYKKFGFADLSGIDLQEETSPPVRPDSQWTYIDRATASFGQGIAVTPIQMIRAVSAIANGGKLITPRIVDAVVEEGKEIPVKEPQAQTVLKPQTTDIITQMMVEAVDKGEAKWAKPKDFKIAGKTGTAQIAVSGHYDAEKTIASFIGFAPADNPRFVMLVTLREPKTSPWGSETAAPLWFNISRDLFRLWNITP